MGGDALAAYDALALKLAASPARFDYRLPGGRKLSATLKLGDLESVVVSNVYGERDRMLLLRALAHAHRGNFQPLYFLSQAVRGLEPGSDALDIDPTFSDAAYFTINCNDYLWYTGTTAQRAEQFMRNGDIAERALERLDSVYYSDLPCLYWPTGRAPAQYDLSRARDLPTLVLVAAADPATPAEQGRDVFNRLSNAVLIEMSNGPHVIFGRGEDCVDNPVNAFLLDDVLPDSKTIACEGDLIRSYRALPPQTAADVDDLLDTMIAIEADLRLSPNYDSWDGENQLRMSCYGGGEARFSIGFNTPEESFSLRGCTLIDGWVLNGTGRYNPDKGAWSMNVRVSGSARGSLTYTRSEDIYRLTGTLDGKRVNVRR
jgi:pimeloyl-ACP methyl ester carboxylesterase